MKIKFWDRLILFFGALLTAAAGIFLFVGGLQFAGVRGEALLDVGGHGVHESVLDVDRLRRKHPAAQEEHQTEYDFTHTKHKIKRKFGYFRNNNWVTDATFRQQTAS